MIASDENDHPDCQHAKEGCFVEQQIQCTSHHHFSGWMSALASVTDEDGDRAHARAGRHHIDKTACCCDQCQAVPAFGQTEQAVDGLECPTQYEKPCALGDQRQGEIPRIGALKSRDDVFEFGESQDDERNPQEQDDYNDEFAHVEKDYNKNLPRALPEGGHVRQSGMRGQGSASAASAHAADQADEIQQLQNGGRQSSNISQRGASSTARRCARCRPTGASRWASATCPRTAGWFPVSRSRRTCCCRRGRRGCPMRPRGWRACIRRSPK